MMDVERFLTRRNLLLGLAALFFLIAWNRELNLLYGMFALVTATVAIAMLLPRFALKGLRAIRTLPPAAFEGEEIEVCVTLTNHGRAPRFMVEVVDLLPAAAPHERRPLVFAGRLPGRDSRVFRYRIACYKRGCYEIGPLRLRSAYPLGISWVESESEEVTPPLIVFPAFFPIASFPLTASGAQVACGMESLARAGGSDDFFGTREYRHGDSLRHIHWPSTARHNRLIVKEFELRSATEFAILLDLHAPSLLGVERESTLEYAVRIAASLARHVLGRGHSVQLAAFGAVTWQVPSGRGNPQLSRLLDTLARVGADGRLPGPAALARVAEQVRDGSSLLFFVRDDAELADYLYPLSLLQAKRVRPIAICFNATGFSAAGGKTTPPPAALADELLGRGVTVYCIAQGDDLAGVFT